MNTKGTLCCVSLAFACLGQVGCALSSDSDTKDGTEQGALGVPDEKASTNATDNASASAAIGTWIIVGAESCGDICGGENCWCLPGCPGKPRPGEACTPSRALAIRMAAMAAPRRNSFANPIDGKAVDSFHPRRACRGRDGVLPTGFASPADLAVRSRCTRARATLSSPPHVGRTKSFVGQDRPPRRVRTSSDLGTHARRDGIEHRHDGAL